MADAHAALSPSARHRWGACPGSVREEARYPASPGGPAAVDGTHTHSLLERALTYPNFVIENSVGQVMTDHEGEFTITAEQVERVSFALTYIRERAELAGTTPIAECRVHPDGLTGRADLHGTVDVQIPGKDVYEIIDYKDGMNPVEAKWNPQLEQYAIGVLASLDQKKLPKSFQHTVIQPKLRMKGMPAISTWNISTRELIERVLPALIDQATATENPDAPLVPGDSQCKYCRAKGGCPALAGKVNEVITMFAPINPDILSAPEVLAQKDPNTLTDHELRQILDAAPLVRQLLDGVEAEVHRRLEAGVPVPGYKLVRGKGSRGWALSEEEMVKKLTGMNIPKSKVYETKLISPAKAEKLTWEKGGQTVKLSDTQLKRLNNEYVAQQGGKPTVAPESDPREAVNLNAAPLFAAIEAAVVEVAPVESIPDWLAVPAWLQ